MPRITGRLENGRITIKAGVRACQAPVEGRSTPPDLKYHECIALVDTGARLTCVTQALVERVGLQRIGRVEVWNIKRPESHWTYLFNVAIWPDADAGDAPSPFGIEAEIRGIHVANHSYFEMLMGMDIISQGRLLIDRDGTFELEF